jgi:hypothetical protein
MNSSDTLFGRIKNRVLTLSGNNASVKVDGGCLVIADGPVVVAPDHNGRALPAIDRMVTCRFRRADCPVDRIVITRPDGFITSARSNGCTASASASCNSIGMAQFS